MSTPASDRPRAERTQAAQIRNAILVAVFLVGVAIVYGTSGQARVDAWRRAVADRVAGDERPDPAANAPTRACAAQYRSIVAAEKAMRTATGGYGTVDELVRGRYLPAVPHDYIVMLNGSYPRHIHDSYRLFAVRDCA